MIDSPAAYFAALRAGTLVGCAVSGLHGRVLRGTDERHFERLSDDPQRAVVFLTDSDGLAALVGKPTLEQLLAIGYDRDYVRRLHERGTYYKLVVFPAVLSYPSDWEGLLRLCADVYPGTTSACARHAAVLREWPFERYRAETGIDFKSADGNPTHPEFMSYERFIASRGTHIDLRALLYHNFYARELYRGDGFTYDNEGNRGVREFLLPNRTISELPGACVADLGRAF